MPSNLSPWPTSFLRSCETRTFPSAAARRESTFCRTPLLVTFRLRHAPRVIYAPENALESNAPTTSLVMNSGLNVLVAIKAGLEITLAQNVKPQFRSRRIRSSIIRSLVDPHVTYIRNVSDHEKWHFSEKRTFSEVAVDDYLLDKSYKLPPYSLTWKQLVISSWVWPSGKRV